MTSFIIIEGLDLITNCFLIGEEMYLFLKEIKFLSLGNETLKLFENEEEYSNEDIKTINDLLEVINNYLLKKDFFEYKNEILKIFNILINIINNKRNEKLNTIIIKYLGGIFDKFPKNEEFKIIKTKLFKTIIG